MGVKRGSYFERRI